MFNKSIIVFFLVVRQDPETEGPEVRGKNSNYRVAALNKENVRFSFGETWFYQILLNSLHFKGLWSHVNIKTAELNITIRPLVEMVWGLRRSCGQTLLRMDTPKHFYIRGIFNENRIRGKHSEAQTVLKCIQIFH